MSLLESIRSGLLGASVAGASWPCFIGDSPDTGDQNILLQYYGGERPDTHLRENRIVLFQVRVRAAKGAHPTCETKWNQVLQYMETQNLSGVVMIQPLSSGPVFWMDDKGRPNMSLNCRAVVSA